MESTNIHEDMKDITHTLSWWVIFCVTVIFWLIFCLSIKTGDRDLSVLLKRLKRKERDFFNKQLTFLRFDFFVICNGAIHQCNILKDIQSSVFHWHLHLITYCFILFCNEQSQILLVIHLQPVSKLDGNVITG